MQELLIIFRGGGERTAVTVLILPIAERMREEGSYVAGALVLRRLAMSDMVISSERVIPIIGGVYGTLQVRGRG